MSDEIDIANAQCAAAIMAANARRELLYKKLNANGFPVRRGRHLCCRICGEIIPPKRLAAVPGTSLCLECAEERDAAIAQNL